MCIHSGRARILAQEDGVALSAGDWRMNSKRSIQCTLIHTLLTITKSMSSIPGGEGAKHELPLCTTSPSPSLAGIATPVQTGRGRPDAGVATRSAAQRSKIEKQQWGTQTTVAERGRMRTASLNRLLVQTSERPLPKSN